LNLAQRACHHATSCLWTPFLSIASLWVDCPNSTSWRGFSQHINN
jgi:hypothetical protein